MRTVAAVGYADVYRWYIDAGWTPLPLPRGKKYPPPASYTGEGRPIPTALQYAAWAKTYPDANVAIVMPDRVIGIDVDAYHGGRETFKTLIKRYGAIPNAPYSTNRNDSSGIFFYQVPAGTKLVGKIDGGIEIIQPTHRYAVVWPSIHPEGRMYRWHDAHGSPLVDDLPELPEAWLKGLSAKAMVRTGHGFEGGADEWFGNLPKGILPLGYKITVRDAIKRLNAEGGRTTP